MQEIQVTNCDGFTTVTEKTNSSIVRAVSIATEQPFDTVKAELLRIAKHQRKWRGKPAGNFSAYKDYLILLGWTWTATMRIGQGCKVHLTGDELPTGRLVVRVSKRLVAVVDGHVHDTQDPRRNGKRCVYGYWSH